MTKVSFLIQKVMNDKKIQIGFFTWNRLHQIRRVFLMKRTLTNFRPIYYQRNKMSRHEAITVWLICNLSAFSLSLSLSVCLSLCIYLSIDLSLYLSIYLPSLSLFFFYLSVALSLSHSLSVFPWACYRAYCVWCKIFFMI